MVVGATDGYSEIGIREAQMSPARKITIEMTAASRGRRMNSSANTAYSFPIVTAVPSVSLCTPATTTSSPSARPDSTNIMFPD